MIGLRTLVLNRNYIPISIFPLHSIPVEDAMTRIFNDTCRVVCNYDRKILTQTADLYWASVVARTDNKPIKSGVKLRRESLYYRDHGMCVYCDKPVVLGRMSDRKFAHGQSNLMTIDHVIPKSLGGQVTWSNAVTACPSCNAAKGNKRAVGKWIPNRKPYKPTYWQLIDIRRTFPIAVDHIDWMQFIGDWKAPVYLRGQRGAIA